MSKTLDLADADSADEDVDDDLNATSEATAQVGAEASPRAAAPWLAIIAGAAVVLALAGLTGWLGYRQYEVHQIDRQREIYLQAGRQGALNLTTISYAEVDADIQRILDSSTGAFHNDFHERSKPFVDVVKRDRSKSEGTVTQAAVQSMTSDSARVLVTVLVNTTTAAAPQPHSNSFRMRIDLQQVGDDTKVSNVEFI